MLFRSSGIDLVVGVVAVVHLSSTLTSTHLASTDLLQAQGIMPRDKPKPEPGPSRVKQEKKRAASPDRRDAKRARADPTSGGGAGSDLGVLEISDDEEDEEIVLARVSVRRVFGLEVLTLTLDCVSLEPPKAGARSI